MTVYFPTETKARLEALSILTKVPAWKIINSAFDAHFENLSDEEQAAVDGLIEFIAASRMADDQDEDRPSPARMAFAVAGGA